MTDGQLNEIESLIQADTPRLGSIYLRKSVPLGIVTQAYDLTGQVDETDKAALFTNSILAHIIAEPSLSVEEVADLPDEDTAVLVDVAADALGVRREYDETPADLPARERLFLAFDQSLQSLSERFGHMVSEYARLENKFAENVRSLMVDFSQVQPWMDAINQMQASIREQIEAQFDEIRGPLSGWLSEYRIRHVFIRCPECGREYAISDPDLGREDLFECYQQQKGKECWVRCDKVLPQEYAEKLERIGRDTPRSICTRKFTLHEGLVEYRAEAPLVWFSRGPYTLVDEGVVELKIGQTIQPDLHVSFFQIDFVEVIARDASVKTHWRKIGQERWDRFEILTSAEREEDIGKPVRLSWRAVGIRQLPTDSDLEMWKRFLISSASKLMYGSDPRMSILQSWMAFELFLDEFIDERWRRPHLRGNLDYLEAVAGRSTVTKVRILLHESLGIHFVESDVWEEWNWTREFRNQVAHGRRLIETKYKRKSIGRKFDSDREIAKFCYRSVVQAIYFIRYWDSNSSDEP